MTSNIPKKKGETSNKWGETLCDIMFRP